MTRPLRIVVIEDEAIIAANLEMILEDAGCEVVGWAADSAEARALVQRASPEVAIVDIQLRKGDDGIALAAELQARFGIEVIFVTAQTDPLTVARAQDVRHRAYVSKPYTAKAILSALPLE